MSTLDLTEAVTAAARRARQAVLDKYADLYPDAEPMETFDQMHILDQNHYREQVLPAIWAAHKDIARQAYDQGRLDEIHAQATGEYRPNPYKEENR